MSNIETNNENKFSTIIKVAMNIPGVQIGRNDFLKKELSKHFPDYKVNLAISKSPAKAGIDVKEIDHIAKACINYETSKVCLIAAVAGAPGGFALIGTVPADTVQYFVHVIRILQKLMYLYGWRELYNRDGEIDDETLNIITIFVGVMFGVKVANGAIIKIAQKAALEVEKKVASRALTKGTIYPIVKKIAQILGVKMTKQVFAKAVGKIVPVIGAGVSGGLTYITFNPSAYKLKSRLESLPLAYSGGYEDINDIIDAEFE